MTSELRDYTNFHDFPGRINKDTNQYEFPKLYKVNHHGKMSFWQTVVRLVKNTHNLIESTKPQNWNLLEDTPIDMKSEFLDDADLISEGTVAQLWIEKGIVGGKLSRYPPTYYEVKNADRSNRRNALMTALVAGRDTYIKMEQKGYFTTTKKATADAANESEKHFTIMYPMLAESLKDKTEHVHFPASIQPKLDGVRCLIYLDLPAGATAATYPLAGHTNDDSSSDDESSDSDDDAGAPVNTSKVIMITRRGKNYPGFAELRKQLLPLLYANYDWEAGESIYLDGELYNHKYSLQEVISIAKNRSKNMDHKEYPLQYWVFDSFYPSRTTKYAPTKKASEMFSIRNARVVNMLQTSGLQHREIKYDCDNEDILKSIRKTKVLIEQEKKYRAENKDKTKIKIKVNYRGYESLAEVDEMLAYAAPRDGFHIVMHQYGLLRIVPTFTVESFFEMEYIYHAFLKLKFEGIMYRTPQSKYIAAEKDISALRTVDLLKHKPTYTQEYPVVGYKAGAGTNAGAIIWICKHKGKKFNVTPKNMTLAERRELYARVSKKKVFENEFEDRSLMVVYGEVSDDGIPLRAKGLCFRDDGV